MPTIFQPPRAFIPNASGVKYAGAKAYFYITGTTTPKDTYTDFALTTPSANPVVADSNGDWATIYLQNDGRYRVTLKTSADALIYTQDDVGGPVATQSEVGTILWPQTAAEQSAGVTPTYYYYEPGDVRRYGTNTTPGTTDCTTMIANALLVSATHQTKFQPETYKTGKMTVPSGGSIYLSHGCILKDKGSLGAGDRVLNLSSNTLVYGYGAKIDGNASAYSAGYSAQRHGVFIQAVDNVVVLGLEGYNCDGDGIYVGGGGGSASATNVRLIECKGTSNRRQGLSITGANGCHVIGGLYSSTSGSDPQAGIDIEPDDSLQELRNIRLYGVHTKNCTGSGIDVALSAMVATADRYVDIVIDGHTSDSDGNTAQRGAFRLTGNTAANWAHTLRGRVVYCNATQINPKASGVVVNYWDGARAPLADIHDVTVINPGSGGIGSSRDKCGVTVFAGTGTTMDYVGNIRIRYVRVHDENGVPVCYTGCYLESSTVPIKNTIVEDVECVGFTPTVGANRDVVVLTTLTGAWDNSEIRYTFRKTVTLSANDNADKYLGKDCVAGASIVLTLPTAANVIGQCVTATNGGAYTYQLRPQTGDQIVYNGIAVSTDFNVFKQGDRVVLRAIAANVWQIEHLVRGTRTGTAAPTANATFIGETFVDTTNSKAYISKSIGSGASDWMLLN